MQHKKVKALLFDLGGVIVDLDYKKTASAFENIGLKNAEKAYSQFNQTNLFNDFETGHISGEEFLAEVRKKITTQVSSSEITKAWNSMILGFQQAKLKEIIKLSEKVPCYLLSNTNEIHLSYIEQLLQEMGFKHFLNVFKSCYFSHQIRKRKPHKETFEWVLHQMNYDAQDVLFIEDSPQHIKGAKSAKLNTFYFKKDSNLSDVDQWI
jgi:putative hydrolase of the HAD superfamily